MQQKLKYFLLDNALTPDPIDHRAVTIHEVTNTQEEIIEMIDHRNVGVSRSQVISVLEEYGVATEFMLKRGEKIITPLFSIIPTVAGVFKDKNDVFDRSRHRMNLNVYPGERLLRVLNQIETEKIPAPKVVPVLDTFYDIKSDSSNEVATKGQPAKIFGQELKLDPADIAQGVYFTNAATKEETRVETIIEVKPRQVYIMVPDTLAAGSYFVSAKVKYNKEVIRGELPMPITIA